MSGKDNLWVLTEEKPKKYVIKEIIKSNEEINCNSNLDKLEIVPEFDSGRFQHSYEIKNLSFENLDSAYIKLIDGNSSFVDYMVYRSSKQPSTKDEPLMAIEETKTNIYESRNQFGLQRITKFPYLEQFYDTKEVMAWETTKENEEPSATTFELSLRIFNTLGIEIWGLNGQEENYESFDSVEDLINYVNSRPNPAYGQKVEIIKNGDTIQLSVKLDKGSEGSSGYHMISHDPNIGFASGLIACLRDLGWEEKIEIINHNVTPYHNGGIGRSKLVKLMSIYDVELKDLPSPPPKEEVLDDKYWKYEKSKEKVGTIFLHLIFDLQENSKVLYDNHAGSAQKYLELSDGREISVKKASGKPDLIVLDQIEEKIVVIEGEKGINASEGVEQLSTFDIVCDKLEESYGYETERVVTLYSQECSDHSLTKNVIFCLDADGDIITNEYCPKVITRSLEELN